MKFTNVDINPNAHFLYGDNYDNNEDEVKYYIDAIKEKPDTNIKVVFEHRDAWVHLCSHEAIKQFKSMVPRLIDRSNGENRTIGKLYTESFDKIRSTKGWRRRNQLFFKHGVLKRPQNLTTMMIECLERKIVSWPSDINLDFTVEFSNITMEIILLVTFGEDFLKNIGECDFRLRDGTTIKKSFSDAFQDIYYDLINGSNNAPLYASLFPILNDKNLVDPFKTNEANISEIYRVLNEYLLNSNKDRIWDIKLLKVSFIYINHHP